MRSIDELRKSADDCTQIAGIDNKFETVWMTKSCFTQALDDIEREVKECYVELPKDADGKPIRVGDVLDANRGTVTCIRYAGHGWEIVTDHTYSYNPADLRHCHEPTVEDTLTKMVEQAVGHSAAHTTVALNAIAEYAAKLQLRKEG